jgi:hypothetical protein
MNQLHSNIFNLAQLPNPAKSLRAAKNLLTLADGVDFRQSYFILSFDFVYIIINQIITCLKLKRVFVIQDNYFSSKLLRMTTLYDAFQVAIMKRATLHEGIGYISEAYDIACTAISPGSSCAENFKKYLDYPEGHRNYLIREHQHY